MKNRIPSKWLESARTAIVQVGVVVLLSVLPLVAQAQTTGDPCGTAARGEAPSRQCLLTLLTKPEVQRSLLDPAVVPGLASGALSIHELLHGLGISEMVPTNGRGETPDALHDPANDGVLAPGELEELLRGTGFKVKTGVLTPTGPTLIEGYAPIPPDGFPVPPPDWAPTPENPNYLDIAGFTDDLHNALSPNVNGYAAKVRRNGVTVSTLQWNWARNPGNQADAPATAWNTVRRMHIASISKFMTAIGLVHMLDAEGIETDAKIIDYLPSYWSPGSNVGDINFEDLMNHLSGFGTGGSNSDWTTMRSNVEAGVLAGDVGVKNDYENMNFGLIRILMSTIGGYIDTDADFGTDADNDIIWDTITSSAYESYMNENVFNPAGAFPVLVHSPETALGYVYDGSGAGFNSGSFMASPGGVGWHMTIIEILDVVRALRAGNIVNSILAKTILNQSWGLNSPLFGTDTDAGRIFFKSGKWTTNIANPAIARTEQCFVLMAPDDIEVVVFVNSEIGAGGTSLRSLVQTTYENNIVIVP